MTNTTETDNKETSDSRIDLDTPIDDNIFDVSESHLKVEEIAIHLRKETTDVIADSDYMTENTKVGYILAKDTTQPVFTTKQSVLKDLKIVFKNVDATDSFKKKEPTTACWVSQSTHHEGWESPLTYCQNGRQSRLSNGVVTPRMIFIQHVPRSQECS